jgi:hypothetical protein
MLRGHLRIPQTETRTVISCGGMILIALVALVALYFLADWATENEVRAAIEFLPRPSPADIFRH